MSNRQHGQGQLPRWYPPLERREDVPEVGPGRNAYEKINARIRCVAQLQEPVVSVEIQTMDPRGPFTSFACDPISVDTRLQVVEMLNPVVPLLRNAHDNPMFILNANKAVEVESATATICAYIRQEGMSEVRAPDIFFSSPAPTGDWES